jgi:hypothetical protein
MDRHGNLWSRGWIAVSVGFKEVGKGQSQVVSGVGTARVRVSLQHKSLCHMRQEGFSMDCAVTCLPFPKNPVQVLAAKPNSNWLWAWELMSRSQGSIQHSGAVFLVALMAPSTVADASAAPAVSKSHWRAAQAVGWHVAWIVPVEKTGYQSALETHGCHQAGELLIMQYRLGCCLCLQHE